MDQYKPQFYDPFGGTVQRQPDNYYSSTEGTNPDAVYIPAANAPVAAPYETEEAREPISKLEIYSAWRSIAMDPQYTQEDQLGKLEILDRFDTEVRSQYGANPAELDTLVKTQMAVIEGEAAPEELGFGGALAEEQRFRRLGLSNTLTNKKAAEVKKYLDDQYYKSVEQGGRDHPNFMAGLGGTVAALGQEAATGGAAAAPLGLLGGPFAGLSVTGAALGGAALGGATGQGVRSRGEALESNYFANLDAGMEHTKAFNRALNAAEISGALNMGLMAVDPTKGASKLLGVAGKGTLGTTKSVAGTTAQGVSKQAARTGGGRFAVEQGTRFGVAGGINAAGEVVDVGQMRLGGNVDASQYRGTLGQRAGLSGLVGGAFHTGVPVIGKAFKGAATIGDGKTWAGKYNTVFREENILGAIGQLQRDMEDAITGSPRKELADLDVMARTRDIKDQKQAIKALNEIWKDLTDGSEPINFKVVDEDGVKKLRLDDDVEASYTPDYANATQTIKAFTNIFRWDKETGQRIPLLHESAHAFMDTLPQPVVTSLKKLYDTEMEYHSPTLDRIDESGNVVKRDNIHPDAANPTVDPRLSFREWFAERLAISNDEWAKGRINVGKEKRAAASATPKGVFDKLSLVYRDKVDKVSRRIGLKPEGFNAAFRDFLDSGDAYVFGREMKATEMPSRTPIIDDMLSSNFLASGRDRAIAGGTAKDRKGLFKQELLEAGLLKGQGLSIPSPRDIDRASQWADVAGVEGRKRPKMEIAEIDAPEPRARMSETEVSEAQAKVKEIDDQLATKGKLSRKERSALRKEKREIQQQIGESFLEKERKPRAVSDEQRSDMRDTVEFAEDPQRFRDQYEAGGKSRQEIAQEAREYKTKKKKQEAKEKATLKKRGFTKDEKGQLEFDTGDTRKPAQTAEEQAVRDIEDGKNVSEVMDELGQQIREETAGELARRREATPKLKDPTDGSVEEYSKRGVSKTVAKAQMRQRVRDAVAKNDKDAVTKAKENQRQVNEALIRIEEANAKHPEALPLRLSLNQKGDVAFDPKGKPVFQEIDYGIRNHPDLVGKTDAEQTTIVADRIVPALKEMLKNPEIKAGLGWYGRMRVKLQEMFGADIELMSQLLGATSAKTPVNINFKQALDALQQLSRGDFDDLMTRYDAHVKAVDARRDKGEFKDVAAYRAAINKFKEVPTQSSGAKFNSNSAAVRRVLHGHWLELTDAPKTPNFAGNLTGRTLEATIDVWAARTVRRVFYEPMGGQWRIQPASETPVQSGWAAGRGTGDFYIAQRGLREAADRLGMNPDDVQAVLWFGEKDIWDKRGWTESLGKEKSSFDTEANKLSLDRWNAGLTTWQTKETFNPKVQEAARVRLEQSIRQNPDLVSARVVDTEGFYDKTKEPSFDIEFTVKKGSDVETFIREVLRVGEEGKQIDTFVSRVVDKSHPNARPAIEVGFKRTVDEATMQKALDEVFDENQIAGWTIARNRSGEVIGFRAQHIPEIDARYGAALDEASVQVQMREWADNMRQAIASLDTDVVAFAREHYYDTRVYGKEDIANPVISRESSIGDELGRRQQALGPDDGRASGVEFSRRGPNQGRDAATGRLRTDEAPESPRGGVEFSRRGRKSGPYAGVPVRQFAERASRSAGAADDLKPIYERRPDIATYDPQSLKARVATLESTPDTRLWESVEKLKEITTDSQHNFAIQDSIELLQRKRRELRKAQNKTVADAIEKDIEDIYGAVSKSQTTIAQLLNQSRLFKGMMSQDKVALLNNLLLTHGRKLTEPQKKRFQKIIDTETKASDDFELAKEKAFETNSEADIKKALDAEDKLQRAFMDTQHFARKMTPRSDLFADWKAVVSGGLLTPVSLTRNLWGNYINLVPEVAARTISTPIDILRSRVRGTERTIAVAPVEETKGFLKGSWRELKKLPRKFKHGSITDKVIGEDLRSFQPVEALKQLFTGDYAVDAKTGKMRVSDRIGKATEAIFGMGPEAMLRGLYIFDELAKSGTRGMRRAESIKARGLKKGTKEHTEALLGVHKEIEAEAQAFALERTFQEDGKASGLALSWERKARAWGTFPPFVLRVATSPYIKTPVNLAAQTMSYASPPLALIEGFVNGHQASKATGVEKKLYTRNAQIAGGKFMVAMGLQSIAEWLLEDDIISAGPESKKINKVLTGGMGIFRFNKDGFMRKWNGGDGSWQAGDETIRLDTLGVMGGAFAVHAETNRLREKYKETGVAENWMDMYVNVDALHALAGLGRFAMDQTMLRGVKLGLDSLQRGNSDYFFRNLVNAWGLTPVPMWNNTITSYRASQWEYKPEVNGQARFFAGLEDMVQYKMGNYENLPLKRDIWGRPTEQTPEGQNPYIYHMLDIRKPQATRDKARVQVQKLWLNTKDSDVVPSWPDAKIKLPNGDNLTLSSELYESYVGAVQGAKLQAFEQLVDDQRWYAMSETEAVRMLKNRMQNFGNKAEDYWIRQYAPALIQLWQEQERQAELMGD